MTRQGDFIWYELATPDTAAAAKFYSGVLGWSDRDAGMGAPGYRVITADGVDVGGMIDLGTCAVANSGWIGYVAVDDVDAAAGAVQSAGGAQKMPPTDLPGVGRMAMLTDPDGLAFYVMRGMGGQSTAFSHTDAGHCQWNELMSGKPEEALAFYSGLLGWTKGDAMPMGDLGDYQFFHSGDDMIGAIWPVPPGAPGPGWVFYFGVTDIDRAATAIGAGGGRLIRPPEEIPGGLFAASATDPSGAQFGIVGPRVKGGAA